MFKNVILLNGPSSSGKSTLAGVLRSTLEMQGRGPCVIVSIDDFLEMTPDEPIYEDDVFAVSGEMCRAARRALCSAETVIIDHVITSERIFAQLMHELYGFTVLTVHLTCPPEVLRQRAAPHQPLPGLRRGVLRVFVPAGRL